MSQNKGALSRLESANGNATNSLTKGKKKEIQGKYWKCNYHLKDDESFESVISKLELFTDNWSMWIFGEEFGKSGKTRHIEGGFVTRCDRTRWSKLINDFKWSDLQKSKKENWPKLVQYCEKEGNRIVHSANLKLNLPLPFDEKSLYDWQKSLYDVFRKPAGWSRTIHWIWSDAGNIGKTGFARFLYRKLGFIAIDGKASDMKNAIFQYYENTGNTPTGVVVNLPRSFNTDWLSYPGLEAVKDMFFYSGKYEGGMIDGNPCHLCIFANEPPDTSQLSKDRWCVMCVDKLPQEYEFLESDEEV